MPLHVLFMRTLLFVFLEAHRYTILFKDAYAYGPSNMMLTGGQIIQVYFQKMLPTNQ